MTEVTKSNFKELFPEIESSLKKAAFVAIDSEFSGILSHPKLKNSLFDTGEERYLKLKSSVKNFTMFQFGISVFHYDRDNNSYVADMYSFYTRPCAFGPMEVEFLSQASSWDFLTRHKFDFNKMAYEGIPFLNSSQETAIREHLKSNAMFCDLERSLSFKDEDELQAACSRVAQWLSKAALGDALTLDVDDTAYSVLYFLHKEIRRRFHDVWTFSEPNKILVKKMNSADIKAAEEAEGDRLNSVLLDNLLGLTKVFRLLVALKKPILGHNLLLDMVFLYNLMHDSLPNSYKKFKKELHTLFPSIFDTKFISYQIKEQIKVGQKWDSNALDQLYVFLRQNKLTEYSPAVPLMHDDPISPVTGIEKCAHDAGWDAYMAGYCFIQLAHFLAIRQMGEGAVPRPKTRTEHFAAMNEYKNFLNVIRGGVSHMNIMGEEPLSNRPKPLVIARLDKQPLNIEEVTGLMADYGNVDVKNLTASSALIATPTKKCAREIVERFFKDKTYRVVPYSYLKHSSILSTLLWSGLVASSTCLITVLVKEVMKK